LTTLASLAGRNRANSLHITNIVRGSFGFLLEEVQPQLQIVDSSLKTAVDEATRLLKAFGEDDEEQFRTAVEEIDQRVLATTREFFDLMRKAAGFLGVSVKVLIETYGHHHPNHMRGAADAITRKARTPSVLRGPSADRLRTG
jgi:hypothetical protein